MLAAVVWKGLVAARILAVIAVPANGEGRGFKGIMAKKRSLLGGLIALAFVSIASAPALADSPGRAFEMVSPPYKAGYGATHIEAVTSDGNAVAYYSQGSFSGAPAGVSDAKNTVAYLARRGSSDWASVPLYPPNTLVPSEIAEADVSPSLETELVQGKPGPNEGSAFASGLIDEFLIHETGTEDIDQNWNIAGTPFEGLDPKGAPFVAYRGASSDFCHVLFQNESGQIAPLDSSYAGEDLLPQPLNEPLYELDMGCHGARHELRLVGLNNVGKPVSPGCLVKLGGSVATEAASNAISDNGDEIFFATCIENQGTDVQLFVRLNGQTTLEVSKPILANECVKIPCVGAGKRPAAAFDGASEDGARVYFESTAPLTKEPSDSSSNLYMATIGCGPNSSGCAVSERIITGLTKVSRNPRAGGSGEVLGVLAVAPSGERVYFVAKGDLLSESEQAVRESEGEAVPVPGADNLYVFDTASGSVDFIADLCSGGRSGSIEDTGCPIDTNSSDEKLWAQASDGEAQTAGRDGRYLVFSSYGRLTRDDTDETKDIYRYDAQSGVMQRVSLGEAGAEEGGNRGTAGATIAESHFIDYVRFQHRMDNRAISEDGSRIVFVSGDPLSLDAINGLENAYEWHEGKVSLLSAGSAETPIQDVVITPSGDDAFFVTTQGLLPQDTDGESDVYDARIGGGFPEPPRERQPCSSDACQGPLTSPSPMIIPVSTVQEAERELPPPRAKKVKAKKKVKKRQIKGGRRSKGRRGKPKGKSSRILIVRLSNDGKAR